MFYNDSGLINAIPNPLICSAVDSERGGRRRALSYTFDGDFTTTPPSLTSRTLSHLTHRRDRHHSLAGEVIGPSVLQPSQSFPYRPRIPSNNIIITTREDGSTTSPVPHSSKGLSPPSGGGIFRKLRSSTWDSAGARMHRSMNPTSMLIADSTVIPDNMIHSVNPNGRMGGNLSDKVTMEMIDDSSSEHSSEVAEGTTRDVMNASLHASIHDDAQNEEQYLVPTSLDNDVSFAKDQAIDMNELGGAKSVTFSDDITKLHDHNDLQPRLLQWDNRNSDEEGRSVLASSSSHLGSHTSNHRNNSLSREKSKLNPFRNLSYSLIGSCIVRYAPCFWCSKKLGTSPTDREILLRLNLLCMFCCATQFVIGILLFVFRYTGYTKDIADAKTLGTEEVLVIKPFVSIDLWSLQTFVYTLSLLSVVLGIGSLLAQRSIREVNLVGSGKNYQNI